MHDQYPVAKSHDDMQEDYGFNQVNYMNSKHG